VKHIGQRNAVERLVNSGGRLSDLQIFHLSNNDFILEAVFTSLSVEYGDEGF